MGLWSVMWVCTSGWAGLNQNRKGRSSLPSRVQAWRFVTLPGDRDALCCVQQWNENGADPEHTKKSFKIPCLAMFAIYIHSRILKTKKSRSHQIRSNDVRWFSPVKERLLRCSQDCCLAILWPATYLLCHIRVARMPRTTAVSLVMSKLFQENFWS